MKICEQCKELKPYVFYRKYLMPNKVLLCDSCYRKCLDICSLCQRHQITYKYTKDNKPICKTCATEPFRTCIQCTKPFPAGRGRICNECSFFNMLTKKIHILNLMLTNHTNYLFESFTWYLYKKRGSVYTANFIQKYFAFFFELDKLAYELGIFPIYTVILNQFGVAYTRKYLLVVKFLEHYKIISKDIHHQEFFSNLNIIQKYINKFSDTSDEYKLINGYFQYLYHNYLQNKISIRSIRLAMTPAIKLLEYKCNFRDQHIITNEIIDGYLWIYPGQKNSLSGFINFLNNSYNFNLNSIYRFKLVLYKPSMTKKQLRLRLITLLKKSTLTEHEATRLIHVSIEYFHSIKVPKNVFLQTSNIFNRSESYYIKCCGHEFYIPELVFNKLSTTTIYYGKNINKWEYRPP